MPRAVAGLVLLLGIPIADGPTTLAQVAVPAIVLTTLVVVEVWAFRRPRDAIRHRTHGAAPPPTSVGTIGRSAVLVV